MFFVAVSNAFACQCSPERSVSDEFARSQDVFVGRVSEILYDSHRYGGVSYPIIRFDVVMSWKGVRLDTTRVESGICGYQFETGNVYLVYGYRDSSGARWVSRCSRTRPAWRALEDDLHSLGAPIKRPTQPFSLNVLAPPTPCPIHGRMWNFDRPELASNLEPGAREEFSKWAQVHAPFAVMAFVAEEPRSQVFYCRECRDAAREWMGFHSIGSTGPERDWILPPPGTKSVRRNAEEYRARYPRSNFAILVRSDDHEFDSSRDSLSNSEIDLIYAATVRAGLFDVPQRHPSYPAATASARVHVDRYRMLYLRCGDEYRTYSWYDARAPLNPPADSDWGRILGVFDEARRVLIGRFR